MKSTIEVRVRNLPKIIRLFRAVHVVLVERLMGGISIHAWNELIAAHDDIAESGDADSEERG